MAKIYPFQGILYNQEKIKDISKVTALPYDVISKRVQDDYYQLDSYNIIRLILGKTRPDDNQFDNKYTRARDFLEQWIKSDILKQDKEASIYLYKQDYSIFQQRHTRKGLIVSVRLEDFEDKIILPHERTFSAPKEDRLQLIKATRANLSPIFAFYEGDGNGVEQIMAAYSKKQPIIGLRDNDKIEHKLWAINQLQDIQIITDYLKDKSIFIADGHHRYETALNFRNEVKREKGQFSGEEQYNRIMVYLVDINQSFTVLPTYRVIKGLENIDLGKLKEFFWVKTVKNNELLSRMKKEDQQHAFGMYYKKKSYLLILRDELVLEQLIDSRELKIWKKLDVMILHKLLIEHILGLDKKDIGYSSDEKKVVELVDKEEFLAALFLNPVRIEEFKAVTKAHRLMPQKSTYFYPKPLSGLVINKFG
ncbi:MAG: DUF1015 domain-containing protein [Candidatus Omnitrophota bacterium]|nr:DUF1015 domain-containing protein [Candidatus Omnitrophota bacterium]